MSLKYRSSDGTETPVAGLNGQNGSLVPSVALYQSGTESVTNIPANGWISTRITFTTPMPDADYVVVADENSNGYIAVDILNKTVNGFTAFIYDRADSDIASATITWQAFKLMTDTVHEADSAHIAQNTANFASAFSETTSYAVGDYVTYNNVLYRCTTAHTAGVWVAGHFTQVTVGGVLGDIVPSNASASNKLITEDKTTVSYQKSQTATATGDWQEVCSIFNVPVGTYLATIYRSGECLCNLQTPDLSAISVNWLSNSKVQSVITTVATSGKIDVALKGTSGSSYSIKLVLEKVSDEHSSASSNPVGIGLTTSSVTSGSTAPITSGGVASAIGSYNTSVNLATTILTAIKATADEVTNYTIFQGQTSNASEGGWYGFKKTSTFWTCIFISGNGYIYKINYNNGTYTTITII